MVVAPSEKVFLSSLSLSLSLPLSQTTNRRYDNEGGRIDYVLADASLASLLVKDRGTLGCGDPKKLGALLERRGVNREEFENTFEAAAAAATFTGGFLPAPTTGGGMAEASKAALLSQFDHTQNEGIVYTPPQYSDHLAVHATFDVPAGFFPVGDAARLVDGGGTQPHRAQKTLFDAFKGKPSNPSSSSSSSSSSRNPFATTSNLSKPSTKPNPFASKASSSTTNSAFAKTAAPASKKKKAAPGPKDFFGTGKKAKKK